MSGLVLRTAKHQLHNWLPRSLRDMQVTHGAVIRITTRDRDRDHARDCETHGAHE